MASIDALTARPDRRPGAGWCVDRSRLAKQVPAQPKGLKVFTIVNADPVDMANVLKELFSKDSSDPVFVAVDARTKRIMVRGPSGKLDEAESLVLKLDQ